MSIPANVQRRGLRCVFVYAVALALSARGLGDPSPQYRAQGFAALGFPENAFLNDRGQWVAVSDGQRVQFFDGVTLSEWEIQGDAVGVYDINQAGDVLGVVQTRVRVDGPDGEVFQWNRQPFRIRQGQLSLWDESWGPGFPIVLGENGTLVGMVFPPDPLGQGNDGFVTDGASWETFDADMAGVHGSYRGYVLPQAINRSGVIIGQASFLLGEYEVQTFLPGGPTHAPDVGYAGFVRQDGVLRKLVLPGDTTGSTTALNDAGTILGLSAGTGFIASGELMVRWQSADPTRSLTPYKINNFGLAVGSLTAGEDVNSRDILLWRAGIVRSLTAVTEFPGAEPLQNLQIIQLFDDGRMVVDTGGGSATRQRFLLTPVPPAAPTRLANVSVRAATRAGERTLILGVVNTGGDNRVLARAVGPGLAAMDVAGSAADPRLDLFRSGSSDAIAGNDHWGDGADPTATAAATARVGAFALDSGSKDAALLSVLPAGGYTMHATAAMPGGEGIALAEIYEVPDVGAGGHLVNASARLWVGTGDEIGIVGFVLSGTAPARVLIRAIGPGLESHGVGEWLADPQLVVFRGSDPALGNDDWGTTRGFPLLVSTADSVGAFPLASGSADAALPLELEPGAYTVHVSGADGGTGVALVEVYLIE